MKRVWITRTEPGASQLGSHLAKAGFLPLVAPAVKIQSVDGSPPTESIDCWTFLSVHAVLSAMEMGWNSFGTCVAIGPATQNALRQYTASTLVPDEHTSEGLFELLQNKLKSGSRICLVAGKNGRKDLEVWLSDVGFDVVRWPVYERMQQPVQVDASKLHAVIASSAFVLPVILDTLRQQHLIWHNHPPLVVPSERIAGHARELGFRNVLVSEGASNSAVRSTLENQI
ncbi:MAG: uroporphyrinogen-III synthase [Gammaproteobacteria bacterium]|nr:uroporphyrinogen-III synthase [Gammaproteobacteria bacterium]